MAQHESRALVLDIADYRETSSLIRVFTESEGRISLVARGLRRPKASGGTGALQPFNLINIRYYLKEGSTIGNLSGADLERLTSAPRNSLEAYALISYWFEILRETAQPREAASDIFNLTIRVLDEQEQKPGLSIGYLINLTRLCRYLGFGISWNHCVGCGRIPGSAGVPPAQVQPGSGAVNFSISKGGILCAQCVHRGQAGIRLKSGEQAVIAALAPQSNDKAEIDQLLLPALIDLLGLIDRYLAYHLEHAMKTFSFVRTTLAP